MTFSPQINIRSQFNFLKSLIRIKDYIEFCCQNNFKYAFYAENLSMYGVAEFCQLSEKYHIKPIVGLTIEIDDWIIILLAKNEKGYINLCYISSILLEQPNLEKSTIFNHIDAYLTNDLILVSNTVELKTKIANKIADNDQYLEKIYLPRISYLKDSDFDVFKVLQAIEKGIFLEQLDELETEHYPSDEQVAQKIDLTLQKKMLEEIAEKCCFQLFVQQSNSKFINYPTPKGMLSKTYLRSLTEQALEQLFVTQKKPIADLKDYQTRLEDELNIIDQMGFNDYFLVVWDYVKFAHEQKIMVGPGRGSAAGSLVSYLLNITQIDPIQYHLFFERFLNPERKTMPDIDIDFQDDRRDEVIHYLSNKYGVAHVANIVTYQTIGSRSSIRDVGRVFGLDLEIVNLITKNIEPKYQNNLEKAIENNLVLQSYAKTHSHIFRIAKKLIGLPRQISTHAAGIVIAENDLRQTVPIKMGYGHIYQTQYDMNYLEALGLIKMDFLGLRNLTILQMIKDNIDKNQQLKLDLKTIPLTDKEVFKRLSFGDTLGIFQLESQWMKRVIQKIKVSSIEDIAVVSALFRPGPQEMISEYIARKYHKGSKQFLIDDSLSDILADTYGIIIYQEQVMQILQKVAKFSLSKADIIRRAMAKKNHSYMKSVEQDFLTCAIENHYSPQKAQAIWHWVENFANYGFNKAHAIAYALISYWLMYLKIYFPLEFYCALLTSVVNDEDKTLQYLKQAKLTKINLKNPTITNMSFGYSLHNNTLCLPLSLIKGIGSEFIKKLRNQYQDHANIFNSLFDFVGIMMNNGLTIAVYKTLIWAGSMDCFGYKRAVLANNADVVFNFSKLNQNVPNIDRLLYPTLKDVSISEWELAKQEYEALGFYLTVNPFLNLRKTQRQWNLMPISTLEQRIGIYNVSGFVKRISKIKDSKQRDMAFLTIFDDEWEMDITVFNRDFQVIEKNIKINQLVIIKISREKYKDKISTTFKKIIEIIKL